MGKRKKKKGLGAAKTAAKTERNALRKIRNIAEKVNIEDLIAQGQDRYKNLDKAYEVKCEHPSPRSNMSISAHPDKEELIMFGGEFYNGDTTAMYNQLYIYHVKTNHWTEILSPSPPPARCSHQAIMLHQGGGQLWIFGGEFSSPNQTQFHHYNDFWQFSLKTKLWKRIRAHGGPSARSGHKMVAANKYIISFGGFHDNGKDFKYFNDIHAFNVVEETWIKVKNTGVIEPHPRSASQFICTQDPTKILLYGGFSKSNIDQGNTHTDMFVLNLVEPTGQEDFTCTWTQLRVSGTSVPENRHGFSMTSIPLNRAICFGGVNDQNDEDLMQTMFYNDLYTLDLNKGRWNSVTLKGKRQPGKSKKQAKQEDQMVEQMEDELENLMMDVGQSASAEVVSEGIPSGSSGDDGRTKVGPCPRMNAQLIVRHGILYLYGGTYEEGDKQITLRDLYKLNLHKLDQWQTLIKDDSETMEWQGSDSEDSEDSEIDEEDEQMEVAVIKEAEQSAVVGPNETFPQYYGRSHDYWMDEAEKELEEKEIPVTGARLKTIAKANAKAFYNSNIETT